MTSEKRKAGYIAQTGRRSMTPRQERRYDRKLWRDEVNRVKAAAPVSGGGS